MASKTNRKVGEYEYFRITRTIGHRLDENGRKVGIKKEFNGRSKKEAEQKYREYLDKQKALEKNEEKVDKRRSKTFGELADEWIENFFIMDESLAERSKELYLGAWQKYLKPTDLYKTAIEEVTAITIQKEYNEMNCPASSINNLNRVMKRFYKYLEQENIVRDVTPSLTLPKVKSKTETELETIEIWTEEEIDAILKGFDKADNRFRLKFLLILAFATGCRISELLAITYDDFTEDGLIITKQVTKYKNLRRKGAEEPKYIYGIKAPKRNSKRIIPVNEDIMEALAVHKEWQQKEMKENGYKTNYLFTTSSGKLYDRRNIDHACERYYKTIGIGYRNMHDYRHTFGTMLCKDKAPIEVVASLMGHADISTTAKYYVAVGIEEKKQAVAGISIKRK